MSRPTSAGTLAPPTATPVQIVPVPGLAPLNPVTRILLAVVLSLPLLLTLDWLSATIAVVVVVALATAAGMKLGWLIRRAWWLAPVALLTAIPMALYGSVGGQVYARWWLITISENSVRLATALAARVFALALPSLILFAGLEATRVADALVQVAHLPARFVYGSVAALRVTDLLRSDWRSLAQARRARGLGDQGRLRRLVAMAFTLLVLALRRGTRLAVAMEARGFGSGPRSMARRSTLTWRDPVAILVGLAVTAMAITCALLADTFNPVV